MIIYKKVIEFIFSEVEDIVCESGGILGATGQVITNVEIDKGLHRAKCSYEPDVNKLNSVIDMWRNQEIDFAGVFHTHFFGVSTLSDGDITYINLIMKAMPDDIDCLYFPIVLPESKQIIPYRAFKENSSIQIDLDILKII